MSTMCWLLAEIIFHCRLSFTFDASVHQTFLLQLLCNRHQFVLMQRYSLRQVAYEGPPVLDSLSVITSCCPARCPAIRGSHVAPVYVFLQQGQRYQAVVVLQKHNSGAERNFPYKSYHYTPSPQMPRPPAQADA